MLPAALRRTLPLTGGIAILLVAACATSAPDPVAPSSTTDSTMASPGTPGTVSRPSTGLAPFVGRWAVSLALTDVKLSGNTGCAAEAVNSQVGVPNTYVIEVTETDVKVRDAADGFVCTFQTVKGNSSGFTTRHVLGTFYCSSRRQLRCADGTVHELTWIGQNIEAAVSGTDISGTWDAEWVQLEKAPAFELTTTATFKGTRQ